MAAKTKNRCAARGALVNRLEDDLVLHVFSFLSPEMLARIATTCRRFADIANEDVLWHAVLINEVGAANMPPPIAIRGEWRNRYAAWRRLETCECETRSSFASPDEDATDAAPVPRFLHRAACPSGRNMYLFGGQSELGELDDLWVLDKRAALSLQDEGRNGRMWRKLEPADPSAERPECRQSGTLTAVLNGTQLLMFGGRHGPTTFMNDTWLFDVASQTWTCVFESEDTAAAMAGTSDPTRPSPRWAHTSVAMRDGVYVFGGSAPGKCYNDLYYYDVRAAAWRRVAVEGRSPRGRSGHCACVVDNSSMFVFGGNTIKSSFSDLWEFSAATSRWRRVTTAGAAPSGRVGHSMNAVGGRLLLLGGREYATNSFDGCLYCYDRSKHRWTCVEIERESTPLQRTGHCTDAYDGHLLVFGGLRGDGSFLADVASINLVDQPFARGSSCASLRSSLAEESSRRSMVSLAG